MRGKPINDIMINNFVDLNIHFNNYDLNQLKSIINNHETSFYKKMYFTYYILD